MTVESLRDKLSLRYDKCPVIYWKKEEGQCFDS